MDPILVGVVHWLHVFLGIFWFGTILYSRLILGPVYATVPEDVMRDIRRKMVTGDARRWTYAFSYGTVALGIIRGAITGVFSQLDTAYGITYLAALVIGVFMLVINFSPYFPQAIWRKVYVAGFPVMFTLMVLMRFGV